jgi:GNAT superfamily N-acetyltransferase
MRISIPLCCVDFDRLCRSLPAVLDRPPCKPDIRSPSAAPSRPIARAWRRSCRTCKRITVRRTRLTRTGERLPFALVAERNGALLGLASLSPVLFSGAFQWMLFLKDLYVTGAARSLGVGRALLVAAARTALEEDYCRIDWTTDATNDGAQRLYDGLGVPRHDKRFYRLSGDDLKKFAHG